MATALHLAVRTVHVLGLAVLLGGSALAWGAARDGVDPALARRVEWGFWAAFGLVVVTGVGNLGAVGVPAPGTRRGTVFAVKLALVFAVVLGSAVRSAVVVRATDLPPEAPVDAVIRRAYGATALALAAVVVLGEVLAHG